MYEGRSPFALLCSVLGFRFGFRLDTGVGVLFNNIFLVLPSNYLPLI